MQKNLLRAGFAAAMLAVLCLSACGAELPGNVNVDILELEKHEVTLADLRAAFAGNDLTPPLYEQTPGTTLYAIVIPFNIDWLPEGVHYEIVRVSLLLLREADGGYVENEAVKAVIPIPINVERSSDVTTSTKLAVGITGTIKALSGTVSGETTTSESYEKIYRSVTAEITAHREFSWAFSPFLDESIPFGLHYVVAVVEVPIGSSGNLFYATAGCYYEAETALGGSGEGRGCTQGASQWLSIP